MKKVWLGLGAIVLVSACSTHKSRSGAASAGTTTRTSSTRVEPPKSNGTQANGFQIAQCFSAGAPQVGINYPTGWSRRVSRAETEDKQCCLGVLKFALCGGCDRCRQSKHI